jgi:hypothetical protein
MHFGAADVLLFLNLTRHSGGQNFSQPSSAPLMHFLYDILDDHSRTRAEGEPSLLQVLSDLFVHRRIVS